MVKTQTIEVSLLKELVSYEPETGRFFWKFRTPLTCSRYASFNTRHAGDETGLTKNERGYCLISVKNVKFKAHRVAYALMTGGWPVGEIDHINGDRSDNRWCNLRQVTHRENRANTYGWKKKTSSKYIGVCWQKDCNRWKAQCTIDGRNHHVGLFKTEEEAAKARDRFLLERSPFKLKLNFPEELI